MCQHRNSKRIKIGKRIIRVDECIANLIKYLHYCFNPNVLSCCCGHGRYPLTIVIDWMPKYRLELISETRIPRKTRFYKMDKKGYYYIPEVSKPKN